MILIQQITTKISIKNYKLKKIFILFNKKKEFYVLQVNTQENFEEKKCFRKAFLWQKILKNEKMYIIHLKNKFLQFIVYEKKQGVNLNLIDPELKDEIKNTQSFLVKRIAFLKMLLKIRTKLAKI